MKKLLRTGLAILSLGGMIGLGLTTDALASQTHKGEMKTKHIQRQVQYKQYGFEAKRVDVTGDNIKDYVYLSGTKENEKESLIKNVYLVVIDGKTNNILRASIGSENTGYKPKLFIGDFNKDKVKDILVTLDNRGIGATKINSLFTVKDGVLVTLANQSKLQKGLEYKVKYLPNFQIKITTMENKKAFIIDAKQKKNAYVQKKLYNKQGKLLKVKSGAYDGISLLKAVDVDKDGTYELVGNQRIWGLYHADTITNMQSVLKYCYGELKLQNFKLVELK